MASNITIYNEVDKMSIIKMLMSSISYPNASQIKKKMIEISSLSVGLEGFSLNTKPSDLIPLYLIDITKDFCVKEELFNTFFYYTINEEGRLLSYDVKLEKYLLDRIAKIYLDKM